MTIRWCVLVFGMLQASFIWSDVGEDDEIPVFELQLETVIEKSIGAHGDGEDWLAASSLDLESRLPLANELDLFGAYAQDFSPVGHGQVDDLYLDWAPGPLQITVGRISDLFVSSESGFYESLVSDHAELVADAIEVAGQGDTINVGFWVQDGPANGLEMVKARRHPRGVFMEWEAGSGSITLRGAWSEDVPLGEDGDAGVSDGAYMGLHAELNRSRVLLEVLTFNNSPDSRSEREGSPGVVALEVLATAGEEWRLGMRGEATRNLRDIPRQRYTGLLDYKLDGMGRIGLELEHARRELVVDDGEISGGSDNTIRLILQLTPRF